MPGGCGRLARTVKTNPSITVKETTMGMGRRRLAWSSLTLLLNRSSYFREWWEANSGR